MGVRATKIAHLDGNFFATIASKDTVYTSLALSENGTIFPSHYHPAPIFHEFVYLRGGQMTPAGYYSAGDHVLSHGGCKEGPYLAVPPEGCVLQAEWPRSVSEAELFRPVSGYPAGAAFPADACSVLVFVHTGPFVLTVPPKPNQKLLRAAELGPEG